METIQPRTVIEKIEYGIAEYSLVIKPNDTAGKV
jgi:hypothetical protein